jgi:predicted dehydrogenase
MTISQRLPMALVGCGGMGRRHVRGLARLASSSHDRIDLLAVCDLDQPNAEFLAEEAGELLGRKPRVFGDINLMAREVSELQAASVTTDAGSHHRVVTTCLEAGLHVQVEKPLALTVRGCNAIMDTARRTGRIVSVAENYRRDPINRLARALIADGAIGTPRLMLETNIGGGDRIAITPWRHMKLTGTITVDAGIHNADILRYYLGEVRRIFGETRLHEKVRRNTASAGPGGFYARWSVNYPDEIQPTGDDALYAHLTFGSGAIGHWVADYAGHGLGFSQRRVYGSRGSLESPGDRNGRPLKIVLDDGVERVDQQVLELAPSYRLEPLAAEFFGGERVSSYQLDFNDTDGRILALEYNELARCVTEGGQPEVTMAEGRADLALTYAPFESSLLDRAITLDEVLDGTASLYQQEIDEKLGLLPAAIRSS